MSSYYDEPKISAWQAYGKDEFIQEKMNTICLDIAKRGDKTNFDKFFDMLYEFIEENIEDFMEVSDVE